jgi:hypothetical protein
MFYEFFSNKMLICEIEEEEEEKSCSLVLIYSLQYIHLIYIQSVLLFFRFYTVLYIYF